MVVSIGPIDSNDEVRDARGTRVVKNDAHGITRSNAKDAHMSCYRDWGMASNLCTMVP